MQSPDDLLCKLVQMLPLSQPWRVICKHTINVYFNLFIYDITIQDVFQFSLKSIPLATVLMLLNTAFEILQITKDLPRVCDDYVEMSNLNDFYKAEYMTDFHDLEAACDDISSDDVSNMFCSSNTRAC